MTFAAGVGGGGGGGGGSFQSETKIIKNFCKRGNQRPNAVTIIAHV